MKLRSSERMTFCLIRLCDCTNIPILTFVDAHSCLPGTSHEFGGHYPAWSKNVACIPWRNSSEANYQSQESLGEIIIRPLFAWIWQTTWLLPGQRLRWRQGERMTWVDIMFRNEPADLNQQKKDRYVDEFSTPMRWSNGQWLSRLLSRKEQGRPK